jgi:hypothetical protein
MRQRHAPTEKPCRSGTTLTCASHYGEGPTGRARGAANSSLRITQRRIMILVALLAPVVALARLLCMSVIEDWYEPTDSNSIDAPPR